MKNKGLEKEKKRLLFTGGSHAELPLIEAAKNEGWFVISTGNNEGAKGHLAADKYVKGDFSDKEFVYKLAKAEKVQAIISGANDFAYLSAAYACDKLGLPGHDPYNIAQTIHIKSLFREMTRSIGIKTPKAIKCRNISEAVRAAETIGFPVIVKPVDLTGGKGIMKCPEKCDLERAFSKAIDVTREDYVIIEEFIQGSCHGITSLLKNHKVVFYIIDNEQYGANKYLVQGACSPSMVPQHSEFTLLNNIEKISRHCELKDGLFHAQFILDKDDYPVIIDPCRRAPGDLYVLLAKYVTEVDYPDLIVKAECGEELNEFYPSAHNFIARECIMTGKSGVIKKVHIEDELNEHIIYRLMRDCTGEYVEDPLKYKAGILIMRFESYDQMMDVVNRFNDLAWIEFEDTE